ncbi:MAG: hypothetical protein DCC71_24030 [Proteobacteria bacterium]|nr:MAG: hypothetical protein DCC71_24030 [Pseudomonadota bacterium]
MHAGALLRRLRAEAYGRAGLARRARARIDGACAVVLAYHRVLPRAEAERLAVEPGMYVTPESFRAHLAALREHFSVLRLGELAERLRSGAALPPRACAITFDDGWRDNHEHAWPALREAGLPATIFLVAERVGTAGCFWPDEVCRRLAALAPDARREVARALLGAEPGARPEDAVLAHWKRLPEADRERALARLRELAPHGDGAARELLDWDEVHAMARGGIDFESHGATHAILTAVGRARAAAELTRARDVLRAQGLGRDDLLAYPSGAYDDAVVDAARRCGVRAAFTIEPGLVSRGAPHLSLPRIPLHQDISASAAELLYQVPGRAFRH